MTKLKQIFSPGFMGDLLAILAGALLTLAFAPFQLFPLAIISPALLLGLWLKASPRRALLRGWLYGLGLFGTGVYWVYISIHTFGNTPIWFAGMITIGFVMVLALFLGGIGYCLNRYFPHQNNTKILCAFPSIWVLFEWMRTWLLTGFPWLLLGNSQTNSFLRGYAPIFSVYGVSLVTLICSGLLVNAILQRKYRQTAYYNLAGIALIWLVGFGLSFMMWTKPLGQPIKVSLIQGNIPQELKWSSDEVQHTLDLYSTLTNQHWDSQLIIWPEAAIPISLQQASDFIDALNQQAKAHHATLIAGIPIKAFDSDSYYNAVIAMGNGSGVYAKRRLVPFGEYIPFPQIMHQLLDHLDIPMSDMIPGRSHNTPFVANDIKIAPYVCYEIAYPEQVHTKDKNIGLILTVSNDAWFGHSIAQAQHFQIAQMRALEMGRPVLFVGNTGITAIISSQGQMQSAAPPYQTYVLTDTVQPRSGQTPWQTFSLDPLLIILLMLLWTAIKHRKNQLGAGSCYSLALRYPSLFYFYLIFREKTALWMSNISRKR
jgi:apolipoprotein N-acyltransferase